MDTSFIDCNKDYTIKIKIYCLQCKKHTNSDNLEKIKLDYKTQLKAKCFECNGGKCRYVSRDNIEKIVIK